MDFLLFKDRVYGYLSYLNVEESVEVNSLISESLKRLDKNCSFIYRYAEYKIPLSFMNNEPYTSFLSGANSYYLVVTTLGAGVDEIKNELDDKEKVLFDACANAYLEIKTDELKESIGDDLSYMFSPGYQGSDVSDLKYILDELDASEIGIKLLPSGMMTPIKTLAGIYAKGVSPKKKCGECIMLNNCAYRKVGKLCFHSERK